MRVINVRDNWVLQFLNRDKSGDPAAQYWQTVSETWYTGNGSGSFHMHARPFLEILTDVARLRVSMADWYTFRLLNTDTQEEIPVDILL